MTPKGNGTKKGGALLLVSQGAESRADGEDAKDLHGVVQFEAVPVLVHLPTARTGQPGTAVRSQKSPVREERCLADGIMKPSWEGKRGPKPCVKVKTYLEEAGGAFLSWQGEVEVDTGGRCHLAGRSFRLLPLAVTIAVVLRCRLRTCREKRSNPTYTFIVIYII